MPTYSEASTAIRERFLSQVRAKLPEVYVALDNVDGYLSPSGNIVEKPTGYDDKPAPWVRLSIRPGDAQQVAIGKKRTWRHPGAVIVQIFVPTGSGGGEAANIGDKVAEALRGVTVDGVRLRAPSAPQYVGPDGAWWQTNVTTSFEYDLIA